MASMGVPSTRDSGEPEDNLAKEAKLARPTKHNKGRFFDLPTIFMTAVAGLVGVLLGVGLFTFGYAKGASYLSADPAACNNCHAMKGNFDSWQKSSHHQVAGCNDCHAPHDNAVHKYYVKAENGFWHSLKFTTQDYPTNIQIRDSNRNVTESACLHCHKEYVASIQQTRPANQQISCIQCHRNVGHER